ncbi:MAG TPA: STAS domain-containing protein [Candidatus Eremiobacteraeota bacterium]|nr:MAG: putative anti-sigma factor antagonist BtrV [bacterium ADurb.Bin363]HPZ08900.1 STAS domain-containing protein [Candidatus Eremiobacteraeota bacterium]
MEILENKKGDIVFLELKGRFDATTSTEFENKIKGIIKTNEKKMAIDFTSLDYINSSGLRVILMAAKELKKVEGKLVLFAMKDHIKEIFDMTGFTSIISIVKTEEDVVKSV